MNQNSAQRSPKRDNPVLSKLHNRSERYRKGKLDFSYDFSCQFCNHKKAWVKNGKKQCMRCKKYKED